MNAPAYRGSGQDFYVEKPGDLDAVDIRCKVADIGLLVFLLSGWVKEGAQPLPQWIQLTRENGKMTITAGRYGIYVQHEVTEEYEWLSARDGGTWLYVAAISLAHALGCRSSYHGFARYC